MLKIRREQMEALRAARIEELARALAVVMRAKLPEDAALFADGELEAFAAEALQRAEALGFETERDLEDYLALEVRAGGPLDDYGDVMIILRSPSRRPRERLRIAAERLELR
jgi:hypothetical protein